MNGKRIGFIGAGKVGVSLGKYLLEKGKRVEGYYSRSLESAQWAATFTQTTYYDNLQQMISDCDIILFTVPDGAIASVWEEAKSFISGKIIGHCSGLHSSKIFSDIGSTGSYAYSIHPLMAVNSKEHSYQELAHAFFTLEGDDKYIQQFQEMFRCMGNNTKIISAENKVKYHAAAAILSNHLTALFDMAQSLFEECGMENREELYQLAQGNLMHIREIGCVDALTGPVERNDADTVAKHLGVLDSDMKRAYQANSAYLVKVAERKHPDRDYAQIKEMCAKGFE